MWTLGIDVAKRSHRATLLDEDGQAVCRNLAVEQSRQGVEQLCQRLVQTGQPCADIRIDMEATGHYWMVLYEALVQAGYTVEVINPLFVAARRNITSRGAFGRDQAQALKSCPRNSFALTYRSQHLSLEIRFVMERVNLLIEQIAQLDAQLQDLVTEQQTLLRSIPALGPVCAPTVLAEILPVFHPEDQRGARKFVATAGLDVKQFDSGDVTGRGKHHLVALTHVANKMLHVVFSVLKNNRPYTPILN